MILFSVPSNPELLEGTSRCFPICLSSPPTLLHIAPGTFPDWITRTGQHEGFYSRLALGAFPFGSATSQVLDGPERRVDHAASLARVEIGWSVLPRWALHATVIDWVVPADSGRFKMLKWGGGITLYGPANVFGTFSGGVGRLWMEGYRRPLGSYAQLGIGKEFQVSENNGLGLMATWDWSSWSMNSDSLTFRHKGPGLQLTWTWN